MTSRRRRPLELGEMRQVTVQTPMSVVRIDDSLESYAQKWPTSIMGEAYRKSQEKKAAAHTAPTSSFCQYTRGGLVDEDPFAVRRDHSAPELVIPPEVVGSHSGGGRVPTVGGQKKAQPALGAFFSIETSPSWRALGKFLGSSLVVNSVLELERRLSKLVSDSPHSEQVLKPLEVAFPLESLINIDPEVYRLYIKCRSSRKTPSRPWGMPLCSAYLVCSNEDDYFLPTHLPLDVNPCTGDRKEGRGSGRAGGGGNAFGRSFFKDSMMALPATGMIETRRGRGRQAGGGPVGGEDVVEYLSYVCNDALVELNEIEAALAESGVVGDSSGSGAAGTRSSSSSSTARPASTSRQQRRHVDRDTWTSAFFALRDPAIVEPHDTSSPSSATVKKGATSAARKGRGGTQGVTSVPHIGNLQWQRGSLAENDVKGVSVQDCDLNIHKWEALWVQLDSSP